MRMCYTWLLKFSFFLHLLSLFVSHLIPLYPFFLFPRLFLLFRVYSCQQLRAHLVSIPMTMSSSLVKITVMIGVVFTKPFPRQSVSSSLFWPTYQLSPVGKSIVRLFPQKQSLKAERQGFLYALPGNKSLFHAIPLDACRFLVFKDSTGKAQVHNMGCAHLGQRGSFPCKYPLRLASSTVDWYSGKLRSIFSAIGRLGDWYRTLLIGNPASDLSVKQHLKEFTGAQLGPASLPSRLCRFLLTNCFCFLDKSRNVFSSRPSCQLRFLSPPEIKRSSRLFSLLMTVDTCFVRQIIRGILQYKIKIHIKPISAALLSCKSALLELLINHISMLIQTPSLRTSVY